jgi:hypothetical protein
MGRGKSFHAEGIQQQWLDYNQEKAELCMNGIRLRYTV